MKYRCLNSKANNFALYGGRGITICQEWVDSFEQFLADLGQRPSRYHSLDRYPDNNGHYQPGNVRWATKKEQARNTRTVNVVIFDGKPTSLPDLADRFGLPIDKVRQRINRGWSIERALT